MKTTQRKLSTERRSVRDAVARSWNGWHTGLLLVCVLAMASVVYAVPVKTSVAESGRLSRVGIPLNGHATKFTIAGTSQSTQLTAGTAYLLTCDVDAYYELGDGSAPTADANSMVLWQKSSVYIAASPKSGQSDYLAVLDQGPDGSCWLLEQE